MVMVMLTTVKMVHPRLGSHGHTSRRVGRMRVVLCAILLLQEIRPLIRLMLPMSSLLRRRVWVEVQDRQGRNADCRTVMVAEREMVVVSRTVWMIALVEGTAGQGISLATVVRAVEACLLQKNRTEKEDIARVLVLLSYCY
jgi:hypothetical protein